MTCRDCSYDLPCDKHWHECKYPNIDLWGVVILVGIWLVVFLL